MGAEDRPQPLRVGLLSTSAVDAPGSMRAYAETLLDCLARHAPGIDPDLVELEPRTPRGSMQRRWQTISQPWRTRRLRQRPHLWHVLDGSRACLALQVPDAPAIVTVHDIIPWLQEEGRFPGQPRLGAAALRWWQGNGRGLRSASLVACDSESSSRDVQRAFGVSPSSCVVVPLPLRPSIAEAAARDDASVRNGSVLHVGNNAFYKNREGVLRIFARTDPGLARRMVMAGPPPGGELLRLASELGIQERVCWLENPRDDVLLDAYRSSSVLLFPSLYEGYGWPVLEAMSLGLPVVCSDAGSLPELMPDASKALPTGDESAFAKAVDELLRSPEAVRAAAHAGRRRAANFTSEAFGKAMAACYLRAAGSRWEVSA